MCDLVFQQLNSQQYYMNMTAQIQRHEIWSKKAFWMSVFNDQMNAQIKSLYIYESGQRDLGMTYTEQMSTLQIAAEELSLVDKRPKEVQQLMRQQEERTMRSHLLHMVNTIIAFHVPVRAGTQSHNAMSLQQQQQNLHNGHEDHSPDLNDGLPTTSVDPLSLRTEDVQQILQRLESLLRSFVSQLIRENCLPADDLRDNTSELIESHLLILGGLYPEVCNIPKWKRPEVTNPELLPSELVIKIGGYNFVSCQLLADGRLEKVEWQQLDMDNLRGATNPTASLASNSEANAGGNDVEIDTLMLPLLPAQGALFLTNYRLIFSGVPRDPYRTLAYLAVRAKEKDQDALTSD
ncbi:SET-binding factor 2 [Cichlidogyrus casuarinus]|uniref:SET-binding factor 2 n=1 Tax=Cichlidogyrus casuarinus TaxID=1844966 RepID=A0ABD2QHB3_9PLAT